MSQKNTIPLSEKLLPMKLKDNLDPVAEVSKPGENCVQPWKFKSGSVESMEMAAFSRPGVLADGRYLT